MKTGWRTDLLLIAMTFFALACGLALCGAEALR